MRHVYQFAVRTRPDWEDKVVATAAEAIALAETGTTGSIVKFRMPEWRRVAVWVLEPGAPWVRRNLRGGVDREERPH